MYTNKREKGCPYILWPGIGGWREGAGPVCVAWRTVGGFVGRVQALAPSLCERASLA